MYLDRNTEIRTNIPQATSSLLVLDGAIYPSNNTTLVKSYWKTFIESHDLQSYLQIKEATLTVRDNVGS